MAAKFEIEGIFNITSVGYIVAARLIDKDTEFRLTNNSMLGGVAIENWYDIPRKLDKEGKLRSDLFVFYLKDPEDKAKLKANDVVELAHTETTG